MTDDELQASRDKLMAETRPPNMQDARQFDFGDAIAVLKTGGRVARAGWNGKGMWWLTLNPGYDGQPIGDEKYAVRPHFALRTAQGDLAMWSPSGSDALAEDWVVVK